MSDRIAGDPRFVVIAQDDGSFAVVQDDETIVARFSLAPAPVPPAPDTLDFEAQDSKGNTVTYRKDATGKVLCLVPGDPTSWYADTFVLGEFTTDELIAVIQARGGAALNAQCAALVAKAREEEREKWAPAIHALRGYQRHPSTANHNRILRLVLPEAE